MSFPSVDLLRETHAFPGRYLFKAVGLTSEFRNRVEHAVREEVGKDRELAVSTRSSASGRHTAVSIEAVVSSPEQVVAVYRRLAAIEGLTLLL